MKLDQLRIRDCTREDAQQIANLYNSFGFGPITSGYPLKKSDILRSFDEMEIILFLCLEYKKEIIATVLFTTVCGQKGAEPHAVWGSKLFIHPQFRNGPLPGLLFSKSIVQLTEMGYHYIDVDIDPSHTLALPLYKRVGFIRTSRQHIDYDGFLQLRNYLPYVIDFLKTGYQVEKLDDSLVDSGWRSLFHTREIDIRSSEIDTYNLHGMEVCKYDLKFGEDIFSCWIDIRSERVAMMADPRFSFVCYLKEGQDVVAGQSVTLCFDYENRLQQTVLVSFKTRWANRSFRFQKGRHRRLLRSGEQLKWEEEMMIPATMQGDHMLETTMTFGDYSFTFYYGIHVRPAIELTLRESPSMMLHQWSTLYLTLRNNLPNMTGEIDIQLENNSQLELAHHDRFPMELTKQASMDIPLTIRVHAPGKQKLQAVLYDAENNFVSAETFDVYGLEGHDSNRYVQGEKVYLENIGLVVEMDETTGGLQVIEKTTNQPVVVEAWPDVGYPFVGTIKEMIKRDIIVLFPKEKNTLLVVETKEEHAFHIRKITLLQQGLIQIDDYALGKGDVLKIHPWCMLTDATVTIPFQTGTVTDVLMYEQFPFALHDYEYMYDADLPSNPDNYAMPWSEFANDTFHVGLIWQGEVQHLLYGLRWMPALILERRSKQRKIKVETGLSHFLPRTQLKQRYVHHSLLRRCEWHIETTEPDFTHYYTVGYGGKNETERVWQMLSGYRAKPIHPSAKRVRINVVPKAFSKQGDTMEIAVQLETEHSQSMRGVVSLSQSNVSEIKKKEVDYLRRGEPVELIFPLSVERKERLISGEITFENHHDGIAVTESFSFTIPEQKGWLQKETTTEKGKTVATFANSYFQVDMAPDFQASIIGIYYQDKNIVQSHFPKLSQWGQQQHTPAGIHPQGLRHDITGNRGFLFEKSQMEQFCYEWHAFHPKWQGISCYGEGYRIDYVLTPSAPVMRIDVQREKEKPVKQMLLHFYWNRFSRERTIHYWNGETAYRLQEAKRKRRFYPSTAKVIIDLGKNIYVAMWAGNDGSQFIISEWEDKGFQLSTVMSHPEPASTCRLFIAVTESFEEALLYVKNQRGEVECT